MMLIPANFSVTRVSGSKTLTMSGAEGRALVPSEAPPPIDIRFA
jgi:hypothetical protein